MSFFDWKSLLRLYDIHLYYFLLLLFLMLVKKKLIYIFLNNKAINLYYPYILLIYDGNTVYYLVLLILFCDARCESNKNQTHVRQTERTANNITFIIIVSSCSTNISNTPTDSFRTCDHARVWDLREQSPNCVLNSNRVCLGERYQCQHISCVISKAYSRSRDW